MTNPTSHLILIVDDYPQNLQILAKNLEKANYEVALATNGSSALTQATTLLPHLILLDVMLPDISGFDVCKQLKANPTTQHIPIIFVSAKVDPNDTKEGYLAGGSDYIYKPFASIELLSRVKLHLELQSLKNLAKQHGLLNNLSS